MRKIITYPLVLLSIINIVYAQALLSTSDYLAILFMVLGAIITTIIIFIIIHHYYRNLEKNASDPRVHMLKEYFKDKIKQGYTKKQLIDAAVKQGWPSRMIESVLKSL